MNGVDSSFFFPCFIDMPVKFDVEQSTLNIKGDKHDILADLFVSIHTVGSQNKIYHPHYLIFKYETKGVTIFG